MTTIIKIVDAQLRPFENILTIILLRTDTSSSFRVIWCSENFFYSFSRSLFLTIVQTVE
jgi:hypothetical protein